EILPDVAHGSSTQFAGAEDCSKVPLDKRDSSSLDCYVGPSTHGDAYLSGSQSWSIIHTITRHGHDPAFLLQALDRLCFVVRQHVRDDFINAKPPGHSDCGCLAIAGQHHNPQAVFVQHPDRLSS